MFFTDDQGYADVGVNSCPALWPACRAILTAIKTQRGKERSRKPRQVLGSSCGNYEQVEMCEEALKQVEELRQMFPGEPALESVAIQLRYLLEIESDQSTDRSKMTELTLGRLAVYELSDLISDDLSELLCSISDGVKREARKGLKP